MTTKETLLAEYTRLRRNNILPMLTVYERPDDYPNDFVVRLGYVAKGRYVQTEFACVTESLDDARGAIPFGLTLLGRSPQDPVCIVEVWV
ncbi:hypothetical protein RBG11_004220 [Vibrio parahaemolyticus]|nr:hypothetical protein [Vibrio parahaemolyticus]